MSQQIVNAVNAAHPALLLTNIDASCFAFANYAIEALRAQGHTAYPMCKTAGEGQYTPPGFIPFDVVGLDGKTYHVTGFSHDAIWSDGAQYDTVGRGNDSPSPIYDSTGNRITGVPTWNAIPPEYWRPNNPPYTGNVVTPPAPIPVPTPPSAPPVYPSYESLGGDEGGKKITRLLEADYKRAKGGLDGECGTWTHRTNYDFLTGICKTVEESIAKHKIEWRQALNNERMANGLPPISW